MEQWNEIRGLLLPRSRLSSRRQLQRETGLHWKSFTHQAEGHLPHREVDQRRNRERDRRSAAATIDLNHSCFPLARNEMILFLAAFRIEGKNEYAHTHGPPIAIAATAAMASTRRASGTAATSGSSGPRSGSSRSHI